ncbi:MAG: VanW family protein [Clostridiales bacterium]|jgi:vancomycin resistance protein YoaR|nr:VanW family protein [Clostridiales bacterium]
MNDRKRKVRLSLIVIAAVLTGFGGVAVLSRGIEYVIAADIHATAAEPAPPNTVKRSASSAKRAATGPADAYSQDDKILGEYTTKFSSEPKSRNVNIERAADSIRGAVIEPGEVFSYNDAIGPTTKENGYKMARIFIKGKKALGYGGGVCQVSSTLYNAAESAGMEIVERHSHSLPVEYVPKGKDAATSYGGIDFKFKNTYFYPVEIDTGVVDNALTIQIVAAE